MAQKNWTLANRLSRTAILWGGAALFLTGLFGLLLFARENYIALNQTLVDYRTSIAVEIASTGNVTEESGPRSLVFGQALSGWYWRITDVNSGNLLAVSQSLQGEVIAIPQSFLSPAQTESFANISGPGDQNLRVSGGRYTVDGVGTIDIVVAGDLGHLISQIIRFAAYTLIVLAILMLGMILAIRMQVKVGLRPLEDMRSHLASIRSGERTRLDGDYPDDLAPLALEVNAMIGANEELVERARVQAGNLAHALKTPLSVLTNEARRRTDEFSQKVIEQIDVMRAQVGRHLMRARRTAQATLLMRSTEAQPAIERLANLMQRVYAQKDLLIDVAVPPKVAIRIDSKDFDDIFGNIMDNACKWTRDSVVVRGDIVPGETAADPDCLRISVEDNGPGLPSDKMTFVLKRGKRLDEQTPGSGLGLSIVKDLTSLYGGKVSLQGASPTGLRVVLLFPVANASSRPTIAQAIQ